MVCLWDLSEELQQNKWNRNESFFFSDRKQKAIQKSFFGETVNLVA